MLYLNLLPPKEKERLALIWRQKYLSAFGFSLLFVLACSAVLLWTEGAYISIQSKAVQEVLERDRRDGPLKDIEEKEREIKSASAVVTRLSDIRSIRIPWSREIPELTGTFAEGVTLKSLLAQAAQGEMVVQVRAVTQDALVRTIQALERRYLRVEPAPACAFQLANIECQITVSRKESPSSPKPAVPGGGDIPGLP